MKSAKRTSLYLAILLFWLAGCGGRHTTPRSPLPASFSEDRFRPNYGGDLNAANYWDRNVVTYQFPAPGTATSIYLAPIATTALSERERQDVRDGFAKWQAASEQRVVFQEVDPGTSANIDVVSQDADRFRGDLYGDCAWYRTDADRGVLGRAVIRIKDGLPERRFRHVALHEIGHAAGLDGHDRKYGAVMYPTSPEIIPLIELSERDRNTIQACYTR